MENDGIVVGVPESKDNFGDSDSEAGFQDDTSRDQQPNCSEDAQIEDISMSTKKRFLRKKETRERSTAQRGI